jgi:amidase
LDQNGPGVNSVIELNPDALAMAHQADVLRKHGIVLGPLHGIPVLLKDNVDTGDMMQTSAGSFALVGKPALHDSTVAANLRAGGAVILGKTNLSEWANFRSFESVSGWSGRGGQTNNPYGINRNPCGSSSGSAAAASSNFAAVSFGTETDGSIVCPANASGVVGLKPTVGLTSRAGIVPISHTQDTFGPHGRTVADAAVALGVVQSRTFDGRDPATGGVPRAEWVEKRKAEILPTPYFHVVFTLPEPIAAIAYQNKDLVYGHSVPSHGRDLVHHRCRSRTSGRRDRLLRRAPQLGTESPLSSPPALCRPGWRNLTRW